MICPHCQKSIKYEDLLVCHFETEDPTWKGIRGYCGVTTESVTSDFDKVTCLGCRRLREIRKNPKTYTFAVHYKSEDGFRLYRCQKSGKNFSSDFEKVTCKRCRRSTKIRKELETIHSQTKSASE